MISEALGLVLIVFLSAAVMVAIWAWAELNALRNERDRYRRKYHDALRELGAAHYRLYCAENGIEVDQ